LLIAAIPVAGCATQTCNMPADQGPYVRLDVAAWRSSHPAARLTVCLESNCVSPTTRQTIVDIQAGPFTQHPEVPMTLHVTAAKLDVTTVVRLAQVKHDAACPYTEWTRQVTLDKRGNLSSA
jgi:hypothetical protein